MFDNLKKSVASYAIIKGFEADLKGIKLAPIEVQKWVAMAVLEDCMELEDVNDLKVLAALLKRKAGDATNRRHAALAAGSENEQNPYYAEAALCEARHLAQLSGDKSFFNSVNEPLMVWFRATLK
jgi:hypothetical protein